MPGQSSSSRRRPQQPASHAVASLKQSRRTTLLEGERESDEGGGESGVDEGEDGARHRLPIQPLFFIGHTLSQLFLLEATMSTQYEQGKPVEHPPGAKERQKKKNNPCWDFLGLHRATWN